MKKNTSSIQRLAQVAISCFVVISCSTVSAYGQQMPKMNADTAKYTYPNASDNRSQMNPDGEIAHAFFTHMGMPEAVGIYSLRLAALATQRDGITKGDFAFHFETGLSKFVGLHIRNDRFLDNTHSEIMFQFAVIRSKDGMSGFSPIIEFEIPTKKGTSRIHTLVGFSTAFVRPRFAFNQVIHYNPREDMVDGSAALVYKVSEKVFFVVEISGEKMPDEEAGMNLLGGVKIKLNKNFLLGIGYQLPITTNREFSSQYILQPDMEWEK